MSPDIIQVTNPLPQTTQTTIQATVTKSAGTFGNFFDKVKGWIVPALIIAVVIVIIILVVMLLKKSGLIKKDYYKEVYKAKVKSLSRFGVKNPSWAIWFVLLISLIVVVISELIYLGLGLINVININGFNPFIKTFIISALVTIILTTTITLVFPTRFTSFRLIKNRKGEGIGYILSKPVKSSDGWLECLIFVRNKWLIIKDIEIFSLPLNDRYEIESFAKNENGKKKTEVFKLSLKERYTVTVDGDIIVNCDDLIVRGSNIYPNYSSEKNNFSELAFLREQKDADIFSVTDLANCARENALSLVGSNPYVAIPQQRENKDRKPDENG